MFEERRERRAAKRADEEIASGFAAWKRWQSAAEPADLDEALEHFSVWLEWSHGSFVSRAKRAVVDAVRGHLLIVRGSDYDDIADVDAGLASLAAATDSGTLDEDAQSQCLSAQAMGLWARARLTQRVTDLDEAISFCDSGTQPRYDVTALSSLLLARHAQTGEQADLDRARDLWEEHETDRQRRSEEPATTEQVVHGCLLLLLYRRYGEPAIAVAGVDLLDRAIARCDLGRVHDALQVALAAVHSERAERDGDHDALDRAIGVGEALVARDVHGRSGADARTQLAENLVRRGGPGDTARAIDLLTGVAAASDLTLVQAAWLQCATGAALLARSRHDGNPVDLAQGTEDYRQVIETLPSEYRPLRATALTGYATCLVERSSAPPTSAALLAAHAAIDEALQLTCASETAHERRAALRDHVAAELLRRDEEGVT